MRLIDILATRMMVTSGLQITWFCLIGVLLAGYVILDGFDLGVGIWYLFAGKDNDRRALMNSITPYWDGNEVWLLTAAGPCLPLFPRVCNGVQRFLSCTNAGIVRIDLPGSCNRVPASIRVAGMAKGLGHCVRGRQHTFPPCFSG